MARVVTGLRLALMVVALSAAPACTTMSAPATATAIARAQVRFDVARVYIEAALPYLSPARAARLRLVLGLAAQGLSLARAATTPAQQAHALKQTDMATAAIWVVCPAALEKPAADAKDGCQ